MAWSPAPIFFFRVLPLPSGCVLWTGTPEHKAPQGCKRKPDTAEKNSQWLFPWSMEIPFSGPLRGPQQWSKTDENGLILNPDKSLHPATHHPQGQPSSGRGSGRRISVTYLCATCWGASVASSGFIANHKLFYLGKLWRKEPQIAPDTVCCMDAPQSLHLKINNRHSVVCNFVVMRDKFKAISSPRCPSSTLLKICIMVGLSLVTSIVPSENAR